MIKTKIIAGVLAGSILAGVLPCKTFADIARSGTSSSGRTLWTGYDTSKMNFSIWDGQTYDTSWYTGENGRQVHAGTEEDPYLIEDADDLAGLSTLTDDKGNTTNLAVNNKDTKVTAAENLFDSHYALWDMSKDPNLASSYVFWRPYDYRNAQNDDSFYDITVETLGVPVQQEEEVTQGNIKCRPWYFEVSGFNITINGRTVSITDSNAVEKLCSFASTKDNRSYALGPVTQEEVNNGNYSLSWYQNEHGAISDGESIAFTLEIYLRKPENNKVDWDAGIITLLDCFTAKLSDFNITLAGMKVTDIDNNVFVLDDTAITKYRPCHLVGNVRDYKEIDNWISSYAGRSDTASLNHVLQNPVVETETNNKTFSISFTYDKDYLASNAYFTDTSNNEQKCKIHSRYKEVETFVFKWYRRNSREDYKASITMFGTTGYYAYLPSLGITNADCEDVQSYDFDYSLSEDGIFTIKIKGLTNYQGVYKQFTTPIKRTYNLREERFTSDFLDALNDTDKTFCGFKADDSVHINHEAICSNPSFKDKYIKLAANIDLNKCDLQLFPEQNANPYGLAGTLDLGGNTIRNVAIQNSFIGDVLTAGKIINGNITLYSKFIPENSGIIYPINHNAGIIQDVAIYPDTVFDLGTIESKYAKYRFLNVNEGIVKNIKMAASPASQLGLIETATESSQIENVNALVVHNLSDTIDDSMLHNSVLSVVRVQNNGSVKSVVVDADSDVIGSPTIRCGFIDMIGSHWGSNRNNSSSRVEDVHIRDFDIYAYDFSPFPIQGNIKNSDSFVDNLNYDKDSRDYVAYHYMLYGGGYLKNCVIQSKMGYMDPFIDGADFSDIADCNINISGSWDTSLSINKCIWADTITDTKLSVYRENGPFTNGLLGSRYWYYPDYGPIRLIDNCDITIGGKEETDSLESVDTCGYCTIVAEKLQNSRINLNNVVADISLIHTFDMQNCGINAVVNGGIASPIVTSYYGTYNKTDEKSTAKNCNINAVYKVNSDKRGQFDENGITLENCNYFIHYNENSQIQQSRTSTCNSLGITGLTNTLLSITSDSNSIYLDSLLGSSWDGAYNKYTDSTILVDNIGLTTGVFSEYTGTGSRGQDIDTLSIYMTNIYSNNENGMVYFMPAVYSPRDGVLHNINWKCDLKDPTVGISFFDGISVYDRLIALDNISVVSNTQNPKSRIYGSYISSYINGYLSVLLRNCYFNIHNAQTHITPSETAEGYVPGIVSGAYYNYGEKDSQIAMSSVLDDYVHFSNIIVPEGDSTVCQYYNADTTTADSWNARMHINEYFSSIPNEDESSVGKILDELEVPGTKYISDPEQAELDGSLAYMLDRGNSQYGRSRNWSVLENDVEFINPLTKEKSALKIPKGLVLADVYIPEECLVGAYPDTSPVYKVNIADAENGSVITEGLGGKLSSDGDIFVRSNSKLKTVETVADDSYIFAYATQAFYNGLPSRIKSTENDTAVLSRSESQSENKSSYTINGYEMNAADVTIVPVFKVARYITIDLDTDEHGTIVPSAKVSASGETITLTPAFETGYTVTDLKLNGQPLTESKFIMPDEDVTITGKVIPFEGGITKFSVFGFDGIIDQIAHTIDVSVPRMGNISNALADVEYVGDFLTPSVDTRVDFSSPKTYTVTYGEGQTVDYLVTVTQSDYTMRITDFVINGRHADINQATRNITLKLPCETDLSSLAPDISYSAESISPASGQALDFRVPQVYTLYAPGLENVSYTATVTTEGDDLAEINEFVYSGYKGVIDQDNQTITVTVPAALDTTSITPSVLKFFGKTITPSKVESISPSTSASDYIVESQSGIKRGYKLNINTLADNTAKITKFTLGGYEGVIDDTLGTITLTVPRTVNLVDVKPDVLLYEGKSIYPRIDVEQDFTSEPKYTVVAADNSEKEYTVKVKYIDSEALITYFELYGIPGVINQQNKTITVEIPYGFNLKDIAPTDIKYSDGATLSPSEDTERDFTVPVEYTVTSRDGLTENTYTVTCITEEATDNRITKFVLDGVEGKITDLDSDTGIITVTIKEKIPNVDYSNIVPDVIEYSDGATISPAVNTPRDFSNTNPTYTVTGKHTGDRVYTVYLIVEPLDKTAIITKYVIDDTLGDIDQDKGTIEVKLPPDSEIDLTKVTPVIEWQGKTIEPSDTDVIDLSKPIKYKVTAENPTITKEYTVTVIKETKPTPDKPTPDKPDPEQPTPEPEQPTPEPEQPTPVPEQPTPVPEQPTPEQPTKPTKPSEPVDEENPNTGDTAMGMIQMLICLAFVSGGLVGISAKRKQK